MTEEIKKCIDSRVDFIYEYYTIPSEGQEEVVDFIKRITDLGDSCKSATEFEEKFISTNLLGEFNSLLPKLSPKAYKMTKKDKQKSKKIFMEIVNENKKEIATDAIKDVGEIVEINMESKLIEKNREKMIEDGTFDEYTRMNNLLGDIKDIGKGLFSKAKKK